MSEKKVLVCIDGSHHSKSACDYGIFIAKMLNIPLLLLNIIEHHHLPKNVSLAGNIGIGSQEKLLEELLNEESNISKNLIAQGRKSLQELTAYAKEQGVKKTYVLQRHGNLEESLEELSNEAKIAIIGLKGEETKADTTIIGKHVETIIRTLNIPILLVNKEFTPIHSILMAYDGSDFANKAIHTAIQDPIFPNVKRHIVNVNKEENISQQLLSQAKQLFEKAHIEVQTMSLKGDAVESLLTYQEKNNLDIIAMGAYSHNRLRSAIFGSFTSKMLLETKKPLLLFR